MARFGLIDHVFGIKELVYDARFSFYFEALTLLCEGNEI